MRRSVIGLSLFAFTLTAMPIGAVWAAPAPRESSSVLFAASPQGPWSSEKSPETTWVRSAGQKDAVVTLDKGVTARLAPGTQLQVTPGSGRCSVSHFTGRAYVQVAAAPLALDAGPYQVQANSSEFMVDNSPEGVKDLQVISGDAVVTAPTTPAVIAGTDFRARGIKRDRVTNRKENTKGLGRVKPKPVAKAPVQPPPVAPPPPTAFVGPEAPVGVAPVAEFLPLVAGASLLGPLLGLGGVVGLTGVLVGTGGSGGGGVVDVPPAIVFPASP